MRTVFQHVHKKIISEGTIEFRMGRHASGSLGTIIQRHRGPIAVH